MADSLKPPAPKVYAPVVTGRDVKLSWSAVSGITYYEVYRNDVSLGRKSASLTTFTDKARPYGSNNSYVVKAINSYGYSVPSNVVVANIAANTSSAPVAPVINSVVIEGNTVRLGWSVVTGVTSYIVLRDGVVIEEDTSSYDYEDMNLVRGKTYVYTVKSRNSFGVSPSSASRSVSIPAGTGTDTTLPKATISTSATLPARGSAVISVTATDDTAVAKVGLYLNNVLIAYASRVSSTGSLYQYSLDTTKYADGTYELVAKPVDIYNNFGGSNVLTFSIKNSNVTGIASWKGKKYLAIGDSSGTQADASKYPGGGGIDYKPNQIWHQLVAYGYSAPPSNTGFPNGIQASKATNKHVGSSTVIDVALRLLGSSAGHVWRPEVEPYDLVTMVCGGNDVGHFHTSAPGKLGYKHGLSAIAGILRSRTKIVPSTSKETGSWSQNPKQYSGSTRVTSSNGATTKFEATFSNGSLMLMGRTDGKGTDFSVTVDGGVPITGTTKNQGRAGKLGSTEFVVPVHIKNLSYAKHTIVVKHTGGSGDLLIVDSFLPWAAKQSQMPFVLMVPPGRSTSRGYALYADPHPDDSDFDEFRKLFFEALNEFGSYANLGWVVPGDIDAGYPGTSAVGLAAYTYRIWDGLHPNLKGQKNIAKVILTTLQRYGPSTDDPEDTGPIPGIPEEPVDPPIDPPVEPPVEPPVDPPTPTDPPVVIDEPSPDSKTGLAVEVLHYSDLSRILNLIPNRTDLRALDELKGNGGGSFVIQKSDDKLKETPTLLDYRNVVRIRHNKKAISAFLIQKKNSVEVSSDEYSGEIFDVSGEGLRSWFRDATVYPRGPLRSDAYDSRTFSFASERGFWYKEEHWKTPVVVAGYLQPGSQYGTAPSEWPDAPNAKWIWSSNDAVAPRGFNYFRFEFTSTETKNYSVFFAGDDNILCYVDGQQASDVQQKKLSWTETTRVDFNLPPGEHVLAFRVNNVWDPDAGLIAALFEFGDPNVPSSAVLKTVTGDSGWLVNGYPETAPGWSPGEIVRTLFKEAKERGVKFPDYLTLTFDDRYDSAGEIWNAPLDWSFDLGKEYSEVITQLEELVCDVWIDPETFEMHMWNKRGKDRSVVDLYVPQVSLLAGKNLISAETTGEADIKNNLLLKTKDGWENNSEAAESQTKYGRIEGYVNTNASTDVSKTVAQAVYENKAEPQTSATYELVPFEGAIPFFDFYTGDRVMATSDKGVESRRVVSIAVQENSVGFPEYSVEFDSISKEKLDRLEQWLQSTASGTLGGSVANSNGFTSTGPTGSSGGGGGGSNGGNPTNPLDIKLSIGTVTEGLPGSDPEVYINGTYPEWVIDFTIPGTVEGGGTPTPGDGYQIPSGGNIGQVPILTSGSGGTKVLSWYTPETQSSTPESVGFLRPDAAPYNWVVYDPNAVNPVANDITQIAKDAAAQNKFIRIDQDYYVGSTAFTTGDATNYWSNVSMRIFGKGNLVTDGGTGFRQMIAPSPQQTITGFGKLIIGESDDKRYVNYVDVAQADLAKYKSDMVWQTVANAKASVDAKAGFYDWSWLGSNTYANLDNAAVMAEAFPVLGVSFLVRDTNTATNHTFYENQLLEGVSSGARMRIISAQPDYNGTSGLIRVITRQVFNGGTSGTVPFSSTEDLKLVTSFKTPTSAGTVIAAGAVLGNMASAGRVLRKGTGKYDFGSLGVAVYIRKLGGSENGYGVSTGFPVGDYFSNVASDIRGVGFKNRRDANGVGEIRGVGVAVWGAVQYNHKDITIDRSFRNGFQYASCYDGVTVNCNVLRAPNDATTEQGFGYGIEYLGSCDSCVAFNCKFSNLRHGITQNPSANSGFISNTNDTLKHGIQNNLLIQNCVAIDCWSAGFDTHQGAEATTFVYCTVLNAGASGARKDSDSKGFNDRSNGTQYFGCRTVGGNIGFSNSGTGFHSSFPSYLNYYNCVATGYQVVGFLAGLRARDAGKSILYDNCEAHGDVNSVGGTTGWEIPGVNTVLSNCRSVNNTKAQISIVAGRVDTSKANTPTAVVAPAQIFPVTISIVGTFTADYGSNAVAPTSVITVEGAAEANKMTLALAGDIVVIKNRAFGSPPEAILQTEGYLNILWGGDIKNVTDSSKIKEFTKTGADTVTSHALMAGATPTISYGASAPSPVYAGRLWMDTTGTMAVHNGSNWMANGAVKA